MAMEVEIAIVGGGLGGLALAVGLQERGIQAHVFEKAPRLRKHSGTTIGITNNGIRALEGIKSGLSSKMQREDGGVTTVRRIIRRQGQPERVTSNPEAPGDMFMIPWKLAQQMLMEELADPTVVHYRHTFVDYVPFEGRVEAHFEVQEEQEDGGPTSIGKRVVKAKLFVGADGVWSQVCKLIVGDEPRDLSMITWNAIVRTDTIRSLNLHEKNEIKFTEYADKLLTIFEIDCAAHGKFRGPGEGARTAFEDAHQLSILLHEAFSSSTPEAPLIDALKRFEQIRIPRCTRIQTFAAETTRISKFVPEWMQNLSPEEMLRRYLEFTAWTRQYPDSITGDPELTYWKPIPESIVV